MAETVVNQVHCMETSASDSSKIICDVISYASAAANTRTTKSVVMSELDQQVTKEVQLTPSDVSDVPSDVYTNDQETQSVSSEAINGDSLDTTDTENICREKLKEFVDAPLPKVNAWSVNRNPALLINGRKEDRPLDISRNEGVVPNSEVPVHPVKNKVGCQRRSRDIGDLSDWPALGQEQANRVSHVPSSATPQEEEEDSAKENREDFPCINTTISDQHSHTNGQAKPKKNLKLRWLPLSIEVKNEGHRRGTKGRLDTPHYRSEVPHTGWSKDGSGGSDFGNMRKGKSNRGNGHWSAAKGRDMSHNSKEGRNEKPASYMAPYLGSYYANKSYGLTVDPDTLQEYVRKQIEYYFSEENLQRDFFLRRKMDSQGFLPLSLIANFQRVQTLTRDLALVLQSIKGSSIVELVDGTKLRPLVDPERWPLPSHAPQELHPDVPAFVPGQPYQVPNDVGPEGLMPYSDDGAEDTAHIGHNGVADCQRKPNDTFSKQGEDTRTVETSKIDLTHLRRLPGSVKAV